MIRIARDVRRFRELQVDARGFEKSSYYITRLDDPNDIRKAEALKHRTYVEKSVVRPDERFKKVGRNSIVYGAFADCDGDAKQQLIVTGRLLTFDNGIEDSQIHLEDLDDGWGEELKSINPVEIAEVAGLAKDHSWRIDGRKVGSVAVIALLAKMMHDSKEMGIKTWVCGLEKKVAPGLEYTLGRSVLLRMGKEAHMGDYAKTYAPFYISVEQALDRFKHPRVSDRLLGRASIFSMIDQIPEYMLSHNIK